jgi:hypothetical protein
VMSPQGGIVALDLVQGRQLWRSDAAAKPLAIADALLVGQAEPAGRTSELRIVALHTREHGAPVTESVVALPPGVQPMVDQAKNRSFTARAQPLAGDAAVSWEYVERPLRGVARGAVEVLPGEAPPTGSAVPGAEAIAPMSEPRGEATIARGTFRINLTDGRVTEMETPQLATVATVAPAPPSAPASHLGPEALLPGVPEPQFLSADGRHVLSSQRIAADPTWEKYLWALYDRNSGERLGEFRTHVRYAPFFVTGSSVVYETGPYARRLGASIEEAPLQLQAADLSTGRPLWSAPVRDITDRRPPPP